MPLDWDGDHPFDSSCVENDMVAKAFGWAWDLRQDRVKAFWKELLSRLVDDQSDAKWECAKLKFSPFPGHHGAAHHGEIADIVLVGRKLYVAIEVKRPHSGPDPYLEQKMRRAAELGESCGWPDLIFIILGSERARHKDIPLLTWQQVAEILRHHHGDDDPTAAFIDQQVALLVPRTTGRRQELWDRLCAMARQSGVEQLFVNMATELLARPRLRWEPLTKSTMPFSAPGKQGRTLLSLYPEDSNERDGVAICFLCKNLESRGITGHKVHECLSGLVTVPSRRWPDAVIAWIKDVPSLRMALEGLNI